MRREKYHRRDEFTVKIMINVIIMIMIIALNAKKTEKIAIAMVLFAAVTNGVMIVSMDHPAVPSGVNNVHTFDLNGFNWFMTCRCSGHFVHQVSSGSVSCIR